ncbi:MAG TPA: MFS transporter [Vicinamibacterales bacterium]|nr:MFS transporter [Vicinamibacterales bacterium]
MSRLCAVGFVAYCSYAICRTPLLPLFARELGAGPEQIGVVMAASTITGALLKLPAGAWSDILGRRPLLLLAAMVFAVMPFTYLAVAGLGALIAIRFVHGSATAIMGPVMSATISDAAPVARRATWLSTYSTVQGTGQAIAPIVAGALIARGRYDLAFSIAGAIGLLVPVLVARLPMPHAAAHSAIKSTLFTEGVIEVLRERRILVASLTHAAYYVMNGTLTAFLPLFAHDRLGLTAVEIGWLFGLQTLTTLAIRPFVGAASDRLGRRGAIVAGLATCASGVLAIAAVRSSIEIQAAVVLYAAGVAITTAATSAYITDVAPPARFGAAHGVFGTIYDIGDAAGPLVGGVLVAAFGYEPAFRAMAALALAASAVFAWQSGASAGATRPA